MGRGGDHLNREHPSPKVISRLAKLVRLAASTDRDGERRNALAAALEIVERHDLAGADVPEAHSKRRHPPSARARRPASPPAPEPSWHRSFAATPVPCSECGRHIERGDPIWIKPGHKVVHGDWPDACYWPDL